MSIIKSFSVGNGDMFYIQHNSDNFTIIDCCMDDSNKRTITDEIKKAKSGKGITRFISTHPDDDHFRGITYLDDQIGIINFYCVENKAVKEDETEDFQRYCELRDGEYHYYISKDCARKWMNRSDDERHSSGIEVLWPVMDDENFVKVLESAADDGTDVNNLSPVITYSVNEGVVAMWMGDMEHDFLEKIKDQVEWPKVDILFAPHHGRDSGKVSSDVLKKLDPHIIVIGEAPSKYLNYYSGYNTLKQNSAGDIIFDCDGDKVHVFASEDYNYDTSFLDDEDVENSTYGNYIGSFTPRRAK